MAEDKKGEKPADAKAEGKKSMTGVILVVVGVVLSAIASAAGAAVGGPILAAKLHPPPASSASSAEKEEKEEPVGETLSIDPIIVDIRDETGVSHHLRLGYAVERPIKPLMPEEEFKRLIPRSRDAVLEFARGLKFEDVTNPEKFEHIKKELSERTTKAFGKSQIKRVYVTDFVLQ